MTLSDTLKLYTRIKRIDFVTVTLHGYLFADVEGS